jgi:hypothetical protein
MNKKESDRLKAAVKKQYQEELAILNGVQNVSTPCCDTSRFWIWGTALVIMLFIII